MNNQLAKFLVFLSEKSPDVFWIRNSDYSEQIYISPAFETVWQRSIAEASDPDKWLSYLHPDDRECLLDSIHRRTPDVEPGNEFLEEYRILRPSGEIRYIRDNSFPIFDNKNVHIGFAGIARDVSQEKRDAQNLKKAKEAVEIASQAKSEFIASMSHDLRTPMVGISGMLDVLSFAVLDAQSVFQKEHNKNYEKVIEGTLKSLINDAQHYVNIAKESTRELLYLFNQILESIRLEFGELDVTPSAFDVRALIQRIVHLFKSTAEQKKLLLTLNINDNIPHYLRGLSQFLNRTLLNLISNALKFTERGEVKIVITLFEGKAATYIKGDKITLRIQIIDTGLGIPKHKYDEIFGRFSRLIPSYQDIQQGSGLGLYTVKRYIEQMRGTISLESKVNQGSCFTLILPFIVEDHADNVTLESAEISSQHISHIAVPTGTLTTTKTRKTEQPKVHVLLVEDHPLASYAVNILLKRLECKADIAVNGKEALDKASKEAYDLIYMDIGLPDIDGTEVAKRIRAINDKKKSNVPIVALTGHAGDLQRQACLEAGMNDVLTKPVQPFTLQKVLQKWVWGNANLMSEADISSKRSSQTEARYNLSVIDWNGCMTRCMNDEGIAHHLLKSLAVDLQEKTQPTLADAYQKNDTQALRAEIHRSLSGVVYLGLPQLEHSLVDFQSALKLGLNDPKTIEKLYNAVQEAIQVYVKTVEREDLIASQNISTG